MKPVKRFGMDIIQLVYSGKKNRVISLNVSNVRRVFNLHYASDPQNSGDDIMPKKKSEKKQAAPTKKTKKKK